eukprot:Skav215992  [mRNA]  locus=scaffold4693:116431:119291:+ [translate_table: standard]
MRSAYRALLLCRRRVPAAAAASVVPPSALVAAVRHAARHRTAKTLHLLQRDLSLANATRGQPVQRMETIPTAGRQLTRELMLRPINFCWRKRYLRADETVDIDTALQASH